MANRLKILGRHFRRFFFFVAASSCPDGQLVHRETKYLPSEVYLSGSTGDVLHLHLNSVVQFSAQSLPRRERSRFKKNVHFA